jgi:chromosome segregation ATPase
MSLNLDFIEQPSLQNKGLPSRKSLSLESLIQQNEDLQARLRVVLRTLSEFEEKNELLSSKILELQNFKDNFEKELEVKDELNKILAEKISLLEADLALYEKDQEKIAKQERIIRNLLAYRTKIQNEVKPYIIELKTLADKLAESESQLKLDLKVRERENERLNTRLENLKSFYKSKLEKHEVEKAELLKQIELSLKIADELEKVNAELLAAREQVDQYKNQLVFVERALEDERQKSLSVWDEHQSQTRGLKNRIAELEVETRDLISEKTRLESTLSIRESELARTQEQLDTTRNLWAEQNKELEKTRQQFKALEKLNSELTTRLNQARRGNVTL